MNRQLINLAGVLTVLAILVAGVVAIALPMYGTAQSTDAQTTTVGNANDVYEQQIAQLARAGETISGVDGDLTELRREIAATPQLDDVQQLVSDAARTVDVQVKSVTIGDPVPWAERTTITEGDSASAPADPSAEGAGAEGVEEATPEATDSGADGTPDDATSAPATSAGDPESPQQQVLVTIVIDLTASYTDTGDSGGSGPLDGNALAERAGRMAAFVDALGRGPRLLFPVKIFTDDKELTVTALTFFQTEAP